ncbi:MAG: nitronate monooxygenase [Bacteroidales bacterium]|nr:nitronate monooxygenase [Bacteroidales bacterium]
MVWCSGHKLVSAVSNAGGLGLLGAGSMTPEILQEHIDKTKTETDKPFGVNLPLIHRQVAGLIEVVLKNKIKIVFTSAGNPAQWTQVLKANGCKVAHVIANTKFAQKAADSGADAIVAEGFEAGGHNGREETTTFTLLPLIRQSVQIPVIAAGGMYNGSSLLAAAALGASGIQLGSRFAVCDESSAHENFKNYVYQSGEGATRLLLKRLIPVRLILNDFAMQVIETETKGASVAELTNLLGSGRCKKGVFEGDLSEGELEIGQVAALIKKKETAKEIIEDIVHGYFKELERVCNQP